MSKIFLLVAATVLCLGHPSESRRKTKKPKIVATRPGADRCLPGDPMGPCPSTIMTVKNPFLNSVDITFDCGYDLMPTTVTVPPRAKSDVEIWAAVPGGPKCKIASWRQWRPVY